MNYYAPTPTDISLSPPKHLQYKFYWNICYSHCYAKLSWTNSCRFLDGLLDSFKCHGKIGSNRQKANFLSGMQLNGWVYTFNFQVTDCWGRLAYNVIIMQFLNIKHKRCVIYSGDDTKILRDLSLTQYYHTEEDSDSDSDSDVSRALSEASSVTSYQLRKKDKGTKNVVDRKDVFDTQKLEESFKMSKNYKNYGTSHRVKKNQENRWEQKISSQKW